MKDTSRQQRDERYLREALRLARRGLGRTSPNPLVGAVVVNKGEIVGRGYHRRAGTPHAEIHALVAAGKAARGGELYVNLEPCSHEGRTPPCADAIIAAGIRTVVVGMIDPNPLVDGRGVERLRAAGITVRTGVLQAECEALNAAFALFMRQRRPQVTLKSAITLDGHVATRSGHARWVSGPESRRLGHRLRDQHDAILVGSGTVLADDPQLDCREVRGRDPVRVVFDSQLRTPVDARLVTLTATSKAPTWIVTGPRASARKAKELEAAGAQVLRVPTQRGRVDVAAALALLAERGIVSLLVEGGPTLAGALWQAQLVDRLVTFVAPKLLADPAALPMIAGAACPRMDGAVPLADIALTRAGADIVIRGRVDWPSVDRAGAAE